MAIFLCLGDIVCVSYDYDDDDDDGDDDGDYDEFPSFFNYEFR